MGEGGREMRRWEERLRPGWTEAVFIHQPTMPSTMLTSLAKASVVEVCIFSVYWKGKRRIEGG